MDAKVYRGRLARCAALLQEAGLDALLLTKPANMHYLTGDGRLCAYALVTRTGQVALGVPTDRRGGRGRPGPLRPPRRL